MTIITTTKSIMDLNEAASLFDETITSMIGGERVTPIIQSRDFCVSLKTKMTVLNQQGLIETKTILVVNMKGDVEDNQVEFDNILKANEWIESEMSRKTNLRKISFKIENVQRKRMSFKNDSMMIDGIKIVKYKEMGDEVFFGYIKKAQFEAFANLKGVVVDGHNETPKFKFMITTVDSSYNEDSTILHTSIDLSSLSEEELIETLSPQILIADDDRISVVNLSTVQQITL